MKQRASSTYRAAKRNAKRKPKHLKPVDKLAGIAPRPVKEKKVVVPSRKEEARGTRYVSRSERGLPVVQSTRNIYYQAGYRSAEAARHTINALAKEGSTPKSCRKARHDRKIDYIQAQKRILAGKKTASKRSS